MLEDFSYMGGAFWRVLTLVSRDPSKLAGARAVYDDTRVSNWPAM
jgi:hypothetical protein